MASQTLMRVEEYLAASFDGPDREYVDGEIVERNIGEAPHSRLQVRLIRLLGELGTDRARVLFRIAHADGHEPVSSAGRGAVACR